MEASWQAYYDPDGHFHSVPPTDDNAVMPGRMVLSNLGLEMEEYIVDAPTDTRALLGRVRGVGGCGRAGALVLSFRGTLSSRNMLTDLKMSQVALPDMQLRKGRGLAPYDPRKEGGGGGGRKQEEEEEEEDVEVGRLFKNNSSTGRSASTGDLMRVLQPPLSVDTTYTSSPRTPRGRGASSSSDLRRLSDAGGGGGGGEEEDDRYRRRAVSGSPWRQGDSPRAADFVSSSPVATRWLGPGQQKKDGAGGGWEKNGQRIVRSNSSGNPSMDPPPLALEHQSSSSWSRRRGSRSNSLVDDAEAIMEVLAKPPQAGDGTSSSSSSSVPRPPRNYCRQALAHLPALRHTLPHIHGGFWAAYLSVRAQLLAAFKTALDEQFTPHIYCTGHSLGGALAQLAAYDLTLNFALPCPVQVYTLGSPRVGNPAFVSTYESKVPATFRVVVDGDLVPGMPKMFGWYEHAGVEVLVDADNGGNLIVAPSAVEKWLRLRNKNSVTNHSLTAYRDCMEACFSPEDLVQYLPKVLGQENRSSCDEELPAWLVGRRGGGARF